MSLFDAFSSAPGEKAAYDQVNALNKGYGDLSQLYGQGRDAINAKYTDALKPYQTNFDVANKGQNELADAMGLNGPEGNARAAAAFHNDPGYQFRIQQGNDAVMANQSRTGQLGSGNALLALQQQGQNTANQGWGDYINRLQPFLGAANNAAGGVAGVDTGWGNALNKSYTGQGDAAYGSAASIGKAQAGGDMAGYNASANMIGAGLGLASDVASFAGGGGGPAKQLFGMFKPQGGTA